MAITEILGVCVYLTRSQLRVPAVQPFFLPQQPHRLLVLLRDPCRLTLPLPVGSSIPQHLSFPPLEYLTHLRIRESKLPKQGVALVNFKYFQQGVDGVHTVLAATTSAGTRNFRADLNLVLLLVGCLKSQLCGSILLDEIVSGLQGNVVEDHKVLRRFCSVGSCSGHFGFCSI